jgi:mannose-1-phosphate guanylyltransferase
MDYAVILVGGSGTRLWPLSRQSNPKQINNLFGDKTLLRLSFDRLAPTFSPEKIYIQTSTSLLECVREILPEIPEKNFIGEPYMRGTAGAIALAASFIAAKDTDATMTVVPADHIIEPVDKFTAALQTALSTLQANPESLITFGVVPTEPDTQYGYIEAGEKEGNWRMVVSFKEKPDLETAKSYIKKGTYLWNSGMFVWRCDTILTEITSKLPESKEALEVIGSAAGTKNFDEVVKEFFCNIPKISIDYAVMEKCDSALVVPLNCRWLDMGSYEALAETLAKDFSGNAILGSSILIDCRNNIIISTENHTISCAGLSNMIIVHTADITLACPRSEVAKIPAIIEKLQ